MFSNTEYDSYDSELLGGDGASCRNRLDSGCACACNVCMNSAHEYSEKSRNTIGSTNKNSPKLEESCLTVTADRTCGGRG